MNRETTSKRKDPLLNLLILSIIIFLLTFIAFPIFKVLFESFRTDEGSFTIQHVVNALSRTENRGVLFNTIKLAITSSILSVIVAFTFAYGDVFVDLKFKPIFKLVSVLPIISPPFALGMSFIMLFGQRGLVTHKLLKIPNANIYGFKGLVAVQVLAFFPTAYLLIKASIEKIDQSLEEASRNLGASRGKVFTTVVFPLAIPSLVNAFLLVFIQSVADFGNVMVIGGNYNTLSAQVYMQSMGNYDLKTGTALASVLLSLSIGMYVLQKYYLANKSYVTQTGKSARERTLINDPAIKYPFQIVLSLLSIFIIILYILIPVGSFVKVWGVDYSLTLSHYEYIWNMGTRFIKDTTKYALIAAPITALFSMVISFLIVRVDFFGKELMEFTSMLAMAIPGTVIGMGYIIAFNKPPLLLTGTSLIIMMTFIVRNMPTGIRSGIVSLEQIDPSIEEAAQDLGANRIQTFFTITLPLISRAFFNGLIYTFVKSMTAVSAVVFLVSSGHHLLTVEIMSQVDTGRIGVASGYATILILIVLFFIVITRIVFKFMEHWGFKLSD